ncbi:RagB/SusD family nutrient uptake outer membrane protein [Robertkochia solimangrovi]|uniref:RagB/SusD family nutrient uptake outer membrane protein n=1 Tax=Robertkochia solimangrovi TaxID=2213046 RepID=UPI001180C4D1|nr:RagB/SusD family nutrient uptake outer membrane protein [Robertkochia solimangrovi]TRZ41317.1 RagB/SusD family nutrient uptake outer membrane protein [Robertkochia solimangrovi]
MKYIAVLLLSVLLFSCEDDFLDQVPDDRLTFDQTFSQRNTVEQYLANIYSRVPDEHAQRYVDYFNAGPWTGVSDEADYTWSSVWSNSMNIGDWNPTSGSVNNIWSSFYRGIRSASTFIQNVENCQNCTDEKLKQYKAEARALRAFFYYNLMRSWGPVILLGDEPISPDADLSELNRSTMDQCVAYVVSELDTAADELTDFPYDGQNAGKMSRPFALALKVKVLMLNASPLFNGNSDLAELVNADGTSLISQSVDVSKWQAAADAAKDFLDEFVPGTFSLYRENDSNGTFSPYLSTRNVMITDWNEEIIFARPRGQSYFFYDVTPFHAQYSSEVKGGGALSATQEMVDAYFMANGRSIDDPESGYNTDGFSDFQAPYDIQERETYNQWVNREPRFYVGITYNNSLWLNRNYGNVVTETWYGGNSGRAVGGNDYSNTGYVVRKNATTDVWWNTGYAIPMLRLAEIYLDYAEALNEAAPGNTEILEYLNSIRERAGIPGYGDTGLPVPASQSAMREAIHKERRVELAFENVRYFDVRRWKLAENAFSGAMHGLDINAPSESNFYNVVSFENRVFNPRHYLWPIPQDEINSNPMLIQNPGW